MPEKRKTGIDRLHRADGVQIQGNLLPCCIIAGKYGPQSFGAGAGNGIFTAGAIADGAGLTVGPHVAPGTLQNLVIGHRKSLQLV